MIEDLRNQNILHIRQRHEIGELLGFETRNKYSIESEDGRQVGFAAEQQKGILGFLLRHFLGHWRSFEIIIFDQMRQPVLRAKHPFRFFFQRMEVYSAQGEYLGAVQQRFSILTKSFDIESPLRQAIMTVRSGLLSFWTFVFQRSGHEVARVEKKWSGMISEIFTDRDTFRVTYSGDLSDEERALVLAAAMFIDLQYFENKASD